MTDPALTPPAPPAAPVEDNPKKPWKAIAAAVTAFVVVFIVLVVTDDEKLTPEDLAGYLALAAALSGLGPGVGTYMMPNPKRRKQAKQNRRKHRR